MAKRYFLQLAHVINFDKHIINSAYMSEKMDGMRAFWDGGISRGLLASQVPWANTEKDYIRVQPPVATGLWSRYGNIIHAPASFLDCLPTDLMLDGELYLGRQRFQETISICRALDASDRWNDVKYMVLDSPLFSIIFQDGKIDEPNYKKTFHDIAPWCTSRGFADLMPLATHSNFQRTLEWLKNSLVPNKHLQLTEQEKLPVGTDAARARIEERLTEVLAMGGEGLIIKRNINLWYPERSHDVLKYKPENDDEATVKGFFWGRETDKGSKLLGMMGAMVLDYKGKHLELSGFTNEERRLELVGEGDLEEGYKYPGTMVSGAWINPMFPIGSKVTIKYRELTRDGIPKEARFYRKRTDV